MNSIYVSNIYAKFIPLPSTSPFELTILNLSEKGMGRKSRAVMTASGTDIHSIHGRHLPHLVRVFSTSTPIMGSLTASHALVPSSTMDTSPMDSDSTSVIYTLMTV